MVEIMRRLRQNISLFVILMVSALAVYCQQGDSVDRIRQLLEDHKSYEFHQDRSWQSEVLELIRDSYGNEKAEKQIDKLFLDFYLSDASYAAKQLLWKEFANVISKESGTSLIALLEKEQDAELALYILYRSELDFNQILKKNISGVPNHIKVSILNHFGEEQIADVTSLAYSLTKDEDIQVSESALIALARIGTPKSLKLFGKAADKRNRPYSSDIYDAWIQGGESLAASGNVQEAGEVFTQLFHPENSLDVRVAALNGLFMLSDDKVALLKANLDTVGAELRSRIIRMIPDLPASYNNGVEILEIESLSDVDKIQTMTLFAKRKDSSIHDVVIEFLQSDDPYQRISALKAIREIVRPSDLDLLLQIASELENKEKDLAISAIKAIRGPETNEDLVNMLESAPPEIQLEIIRVVGERNMTEALSQLLKLTKGNDQKVRIVAIETIGKIGSKKQLQEVLDLLPRVTSSKEQRAIENAIYQLALQEVDENSQTSVLVSQLEDSKTTNEKVSLIGIIGKLANPNDYPVLKRYLMGNELELKIAAVKAVAEWPNLDPLRDLMHILKKETELRLHALALNSTMELIDHSVLTNQEQAEALKEILTYALNDSEKKKLISGFGSVKDISAVRALVELMGEKELQAEIEASIKRIVGRYNESIPEEMTEELNKAEKRSSNTEFRSWVGEVTNR